MSMDPTNLNAFFYDSSDPTQTGDPSDTYIEDGSALPAHARFSASQSKMWLNCPDSWYEVERAKSDPDYHKRINLPAAEGTAAHTLVAMCLDADKVLQSILSQDTPVVADLKTDMAAHLENNSHRFGFFEPEFFLGWVINSATGEIHMPDIDTNKPYGILDPQFGVTLWEVTSDMASAVAVFIQEVESHMIRLNLSRAALMVEQRFDMSWMRPDMGGTTDVCLFAWPLEIVVLDYKHGRGVYVPITDNTQLPYYACGSAYLQDWDFAYVTMVIVQPRCPPKSGESTVRSKTIPRKELWDFVEYLSSGVDRVLEGYNRYPRKTGDHCTFCPALATCPAAREAVYQAAELDFSAVGSMEVTLPNDRMSNTELAEMARAIPLLDKWTKAVLFEVQVRLMRGEVVEGFKLGRKKSRRQLSPTLSIFNQQTSDIEDMPLTPKMLIEHITTRLREVGFEEPIPNAKFFQPFKLLGPRGLEQMKIVEGRTKSATQVRKALREAVAEVTIRPEGRITVLPADDPAPAIDIQSLTELDFEPVEEYVHDGEGEE